MASGVFDILHLGHVHYLRESKSFGDYLVVVIASDYTAQNHGKELVFNENERSALVSELKMVDEVMVGHSDDNIFKTVAELKPDIITLGYDQNATPPAFVYHHDNNPIGLSDGGFSGSIP